MLFARLLQGFTWSLPPGVDGVCPRSSPTWDSTRSRSSLRAGDPHQPGAEEHAGQDGGPAAAHPGGCGGHPGRRLGARPTRRSSRRRKPRSRMVRRSGLSPSAQRTTKTASEMEGRTETAPVKLWLLCSAGSRSRSAALLKLGGEAGPAVAWSGRGLGTAWGWTRLETFSPPSQKNPPAALQAVKKLPSGGLNGWRCSQPFFLISIWPGQP
ncbi:hypothetical protein VPH35_078783 [Triticum aestivum]